MAEIHLLGISSIINKEENINYSTILSPTRTLVIPVSFRYTAIHNLYLPDFVCDADAFPATISGDHGNEPSVLEKYQLDFWCRWFEEKICGRRICQAFPLESDAVICYSLYITFM